MINGKTLELAIYVFGYVTYNLWMHLLRHYPNPKFDATTRLPSTFLASEQKDFTRSMVILSALLPISSPTHVARRGTVILQEKASGVTLKIFVTVQMEFS